MDAPPPYYSPAPRKSNVGLIVAIVLGILCVCCVLPIVGLGGLGWWGFNKMKGTLSCSITFRNLQAAIEDYADEHNGKLPKAATWQTDIHPYFEREVDRNKRAQQMFSNGPIDAVGCANSDSPATGIAYNSKLAGKKIGDIKDPLKEVLLFEVPETGSNLNKPYTPQPYETSPTMFGNKRGWYVCGLAGNVQVDRNGVRSDLDVNTGAAR